MRPPEHPHLRAWRDQDLEPFVALHADPDVGYWLGGAWSEANSRAAFERIRSPRTEGVARWPVVDEAGELVGVAGLQEVRPGLALHPAIEAVWRLHPCARGRGLVTFVMGPILARGFAAAGLERIVALTARANVASQAVMRRLGFAAASEADFDHPALAEGHPLRPHVVHVLERSRAASC